MRLLMGIFFEAYDHESHASAIAVLKAKGVAECLIAAWLREVRKSQSVNAIDQNMFSKPISRTRSLLQGDPLAPAPALVDAILDTPAIEFEKICEANGWGINLNQGSRLYFFLFADNFRLFANS
jgi:hypothetical protein